MQARIVKVAKLPLTCYCCGQTGYIARNCPQNRQLARTAVTKMSNEERQILLEELNVVLDAEAAKARIVEVTDEDLNEGEQKGFVAGQE